MGEGWKNRGLPVDQGRPPRRLKRRASPVSALVTARIFAIGKPPDIEYRIAVQFGGILHVEGPVAAETVPLRSGRAGGQGKQKCGAGWQDKILHRNRFRDQQPRQIACRDWITSAVRGVTVVVRKGPSAEQEEKEKEATRYRAAPKRSSYLPSLDNSITLGGGEACQAKSPSQQGLSG